MAHAHRRTGSLQPDELAHAAVMAAICGAIAVTTVALPIAFPLAALTTVPMAVVAYRYRLRVLGAATVSATIVSFLVVGMGGPCVVVIGAYIGGLVGVLKRRGVKGTSAVFATSLVAGAVFGVIFVGLMVVLSGLRELVFDQVITITSEAAANIVSVVPGSGLLAQGIRDLAAAMIHYWPALIIVSSIVLVSIVKMVGWWALSRMFARLGGVPDVHQLNTYPDDRPVAPVPIALRDVCFRYPDCEQDAAGPLNLDVASGEHLAVTGANGSGKTTLMLLLSGRRPTAGTLERPGSVGLGEFGGTAVVMQHPESQVLGTRVADDVIWGLPPGATADVERLLAEVGLAGLGDRDTGGLSGGELQRLAVAAALARKPKLMIADEITSMVDQEGRDSLIKMLTGLTQQHDMTLVHITHYNDEANTADRLVNLTGRDDNIGMVATATVPSFGSPPDRHAGEKLFELHGVGHEYGRGTPWASAALRNIDLVIGEGEGVLIHGNNGSGKSTLAWIMAGLLAPTSGRCLLDGTPVAEQIGAVGVSFQAARLQLMRGRVGLEVASAAGFDPEDTGRIEETLATVGLDPSLAPRRIDQLSGGQMRRVVLAGLLARGPRAVILDEPLAGLDAVSSRGLLRLLTDLRRDTGLTVVVISHDFGGLEELCSRTLHLRDGTLISATMTTGDA